MYKAEGTSFESANKQKFQEKISLTQKKRIRVEQTNAAYVNRKLLSDEKMIR